MPSELPSSNTPSPKRPYPPSVKLFLFVLGTGGTVFGLSQFVRSQISDEAHMSATLLMICGIVLLVMLFRDNGASAETAPATQANTPQEQTASNSQDTVLPEPAKSAPSAFDLAMSRSDNIPASLKDLIDTNQLQRPELQEMLVRSGLLDARRVPDTKGFKFPKNKRYWLNARTKDFNEDQYNDFIALEATLNIADDIEALPAHYRDKALSEKISTVLRNILTKIPQPQNYLSAHATLSPNETDWNVRFFVASYLENLSLPFRQPTLFAYDPDTATLIFDTKVPAPRAFSFVSFAQNVQITYARAYALRVAAVLSSGILNNYPISRIVINEFVNAHTEHPILSCDVNATSLESLVSAAQSPTLETGEFPQISCLRFSLTENGWFEPTEPYKALTSPSEEHPLFYAQAEVRDEAAPKDVQEITSAKRISDLSFREDCGRIETWNAIVAELGDSTAHAVAVLKNAQQSTKNTVTMEAFSRVIHALVSGSVDVSNKPELAHLFMSGSDLDGAIAHMREVFDTEDVSRETFVASLKVLEEKLEPITNLGMYLDDTDSVYRYFDSITDRIDYNRTYSSDSRQVVLVPDAYYDANALLVRAYNQIDEPEKALRYAEECIRIAPLNADALLYKDRTLQDLSRNAEAAKLVRELIPYKLRQYDVAFLYYRLAYLEWRLGHGDIAVACYQQVLKMDTEFSYHAQDELTELMKTDPTLVKIDDDKLNEFFNIHGIPIDDQEARYQILRSAAIACTNNKIYAPAALLLHQALFITYDDETDAVRMSLTAPAQ